MEGSSGSNLKMYGIKYNPFSVVVINNVQMFVYSVNQSENILYSLTRFTYV